jgi:iron complex outermembrane receptor protein
MKTLKFSQRALALAITHIIALGGFSFGQIALAQNNESTAALDEVTVTARRKSENLQDVPDSVIAISAETIERANISAARDITSRIPNVTIVESLSPSSTFIIVRGISSVRNSEPAVAVVVDGVQIGSASEVSQSLFDVEQIELLKGPQGALYGRNAIGGAMIVTTKKPTNEMEGKLNIGKGNGDLFEVSGSLSGPLTESLQFRISGNQRSFGGVIKNEYLSNVLGRSGQNVTGPAPSASYMDFEEDRDFRGQLFWAINDSTTADYRYAQNNLESGAMWYRNIYRLESDPNKTYEFPINSNGNPTAIRSIDTHTLKIDHTAEAGVLTSITSTTDTNERYGVAGETRGNDRTGNVLFYTEPYVNQFINGLGAVDKAFFSAQLGAWAAGNFVGSDQYYDIQTVSQEVRFAGDANEKLSYVVGAYGLLTDRKDTIRNTWETPNGQPFNCTPAYPGGPIVTDFSTCNGLINSTQNSQDNKSWALFFSSDYKFTDDLTLTLAGRYDVDDREVTRIDGPTVDTFDKGVGNCDSVANPDKCAAAGSKLNRKFTAFQPKVSLAYEPNKNLTYYGTYARGFRSGGFNASGALLTESYDQEDLDSFELGFKSTMLENRLRANGAFFYQKYHNAQQFEFDGNIFVQSLYNIPESEIKGIELSLDFAATDNLTLGAAIGVMQSEITEFDPVIHERMQTELMSRTANTVKLPAGTLAAFNKKFEGEHLPNFPHKSANLSLQHELPLSGERKLISRIDYTYSADRYWWIDGQDVQENLSLIDASIALALTDKLELQFWCKNCGDEIYDSEYAPQEKELFGGAAKDVAYRARGRTLGLKAKYSF